MQAQGWFNRVWYRHSPPPLWLMPLSFAYGAGAAARRSMYRRGWLQAVHLPCPVVIVGNLTVGGTGKTPLVGWLAARLAAAGRRPGIVARGYRSMAGGPRLVAASDDASVVGDEPLLLARRTGLPVAIGRARPAAARRLIDGGCDVIVSDDGLQHYALRRDCEILVVDGERRFGNGWLLPAGPLRESAARCRSVDALVVNGGAASAGEWPMRLEAHSAVALRGGAAVPLHEFQGLAVHAIAGIGNPQRFFRMLRDRGIEVTAHAHDDHARYTAADIRFADGKPVLMTEKDAVKCASWADERHWAVPVDAEFAEDAAQALVGIVMQRIAAAARQQGEGEVQSG